MTNDEAIQQCDPEFAGRLRLVLHDLTQAGYHPRLACTYRTEAQQRSLLEQGKTTVAWSFHNHKFQGRPAALAADFYDQHLGWPPASHPFWSAIGRYAKNRGLNWGGRWKRFRDLGHVETARLTLAQAHRQTN